MEKRRKRGGIGKRERRFSRQEPVQSAYVSNLVLVALLQLAWSRGLLPMAFHPSMGMLDDLFPDNARLLVPIYLDISSR